MNLLSNISTNERPNGLWMCVYKIITPNLSPDSSRYLNPAPSKSRASRRAFQREMAATILATPYTKDEGITLAKGWVYQSFFRVPAGSTLYQTNCGRIVAIGRDGQVADVEPIISEVKRTTVREYSPVLGVLYIYALVAVLNKIIKLCLFRLTQPIPQDNCALLRTLKHETDNFLPVLEGFFIAIFSRPPPIHSIFTAC